MAYAFNELIVIDFLLYKGKTIQLLGFTAAAILESTGSDKKEAPRCVPVIGHQAGKCSEKLYLKKHTKFKLITIKLEVPCTFVQVNTHGRRNFTNYFY